MGIVRLGELHLRWCKQCNVPVLESTECGNCHGRTEPVSLTPPGDVRPAFAHDIDFIRSLAERDFGPGCGKALLPEGRIVLLNKVPGLDRMEEIIVDGTVVAASRYDLGLGWKLILRVAAARMMQHIASKGVIVADDGAVAPMQKSTSLMVPGVVSAVPGIKKGDEVFVVDSRHLAFATGSAKMSTEEMTQLEKGAAVKTRWADLPAENVPRTDAQDWDLVIRANGPVMERRIWDAIKFVRETVAELGLPAVVSFSGGKDSLATMLLTRDAGLDLPAFFIDTGLEFPETVKYVYDIAEQYHLKLIVEKAPEHAFFGNLDYFGPPGRDFRWCCKTNKLGPTVKAIMEHFPGGVLSVHRPEEVRIGAAGRQAAHLAQPLDTRTGGSVTDPALDGAARLALHLHEESAIQPLVRAWTGPDRLLPVPGLGPGRAGAGQGGVGPLQGMGRLPAQVRRIDRPAEGMGGAGPVEMETRSNLGQGGAGAHRHHHPGAAEEGGGGECLEAAHAEDAGWVLPLRARFQHRRGVLTQTGPGPRLRPAEHGRRGDVERGGGLVLHRRRHRLRRRARSSPRAATRRR